MKTRLDIVRQVVVWTWIAYLVLHPEWRVEGPGLTVYISSWLWAEPRLPEGWVATGINWFGNLPWLLIALLILWRPNQPAAAAGAPQTARG